MMMMQRAKEEDDDAKEKMGTNIHFSYGGKYSRDGKKFERISKNSTYIIPFKNASVDEIFYSSIIDKIRRKVARVGIGGDNCKLKLSFIPMVNNLKREVEVCDDDDVYGYLITVDQAGFRNVLNVEVIKDKECHDRSEEISKVGGGSSFGVNYEEMEGNGIDGDYVNNDGIITIHTTTNATGSEYAKPIIEEHETDYGRGIVEVDDCCMNNTEDDYGDLPRAIERSQCEEWDDGTGIEVGQEFCSKEALKDLVERASHQQCFGVHTYKSDRSRIILKCSEGIRGCTWYLRASKVKQSENFKIKVYRKMHICSRISGSSNIGKRKPTPRLVASVVHGD